MLSQASISFLFYTQSALLYQAKFLVSVDFPLSQGQGTNIAWYVGSNFITLFRDCLGLNSSLI